MDATDGFDLEVLRLEAALVQPCLSFGQLWVQALQTCQERLEQASELALAKQACKERRELELASNWLALMLLCFLLAATDTHRPLLRSAAVILEPYAGSLFHQMLHPMLRRRTQAPQRGILGFPYGLDYAAVRAAFQVLRLHHPDSGGNVPATVLKPSPFTATLRREHNLARPPRSHGTEGLILLHFSKSSKEFKQRLHSGELLQRCRRRLEVAGCRWLLEDDLLDRGRFGVKVFVHPNQYQEAMRLLPTRRLFPRHVLVAESLLSVVLESLEGCPGAQLKPNGKEVLGTVPQDDEDWSNEAQWDLVSLYRTSFNVVERNSFLNISASYEIRSRRVTWSDGEGSNPRQRRPDFGALSLSNDSEDESD